MSRFTSRERLLLAILGAVMLFTLVYFLVTPQVMEYRQICYEIEQTIKKCDQLTKVSEELQVEQNKLLVSESQLQKLQGNFNKELLDGGLYFKLEEGAQANNVTIKEVIPQKVIDNGTFLHLPLTISFSGSYGDTLAYMQWLENMNDWANLSEITQFTIEPDKENSNSSDRVNSTLTLSLYSNPTPKGRMQIEALAIWPVGRTNGFIPLTEYHYLHNNQQNGGQ